MKTDRSLTGHCASVILATAAVFASTVGVRAEPFEEIAGFSSLKIDQAKLEKGGIISARTPGMNHPRGLSIESVFVVEAPFEKTVQSLKGWNGSRHSDLKVYLHGDLSGSPDPGNFQKLASAPKNASVKAFVSDTVKGKAQLSPAEA